MQVEMVHGKITMILRSIVIICAKINQQTSGHNESSVHSYKLKTNFSFPKKKRNGQSGKDQGGTFESNPMSRVYLFLD
jgi:hypothetical protein